MEEVIENPTNAAKHDELPAVVISLLKGVVEEEKDSRLWHSLLNHQIRVRDYVSTLGLDLLLDEAEGYAFLRSKPQAEDVAGAQMPRLMARRQLSYPVSLLLALLRKKLAEFDAQGADTRLVLSREEIVQMLQVFLPESTNEAKIVNQVETHLNKIVELGFLRKLKSSSSRDDLFEIRRILKAFVDAQWLSDFDSRLADYQKHLAAGAGEADD